MENELVKILKAIRGTQNLEEINDIYNQIKNKNIKFIIKSILEEDYNCENLSSQNIFDSYKTNIIYALEDLLNEIINKKDLKIDNIIDFLKEKFNDKFEEMCQEEDTDLLCETSFLQEVIDFLSHENLTNKINIENINALKKYNIDCQEFYHNLMSAHYDLALGNSTKDIIIILNTILSY